MKKYSDELWLEIKMKFVQDGLNAHEISGQYNGKPTHQAISKRARAEGWSDERRDHVRKKFERLSPTARAEKIMDRLDELLCDENLSVNQFSDSLKKMSATLVEMKNPLFILPMKLEAIKDLVVFMQTNYSNFNTEKFSKMVGQFKDKLMEDAYKAVEQ